MSLLAPIYNLLGSLAGRITSARADKLDNLDATIASRAAASTALSKLTWTDAKAVYLDASIAGRAPAATALSSDTWTVAKAGRLDYLDQAISTRSTLTAPQVWAEGSRTLSTGVGRSVLLTSGASWTVPTGVTGIVVTLCGGGGGLARSL